jgi:dipeptidyl aminopeptidase/acylaminoacyl peptidase
VTHRALYSALALILMIGLILAAASIPNATTTAQIDATAVQATLNASVDLLFTQTAQAAQSTPNTTATVQALFDAALTATAAAGASSPGGVPVDQLAVIETIALDLTTGPARTSAYLSPSGEQFAHFDGSQVCLYATADGSVITCAPLPEELRRYQSSSVRWSPDERYLALVDTEAYRDFRDSDLWLINAETLTFTNLTDDGTMEAPFLPDALEEGEVPGLVDLVPQWSADSAHIIFYRVYLDGEALRAGFFRIPVTGGEPEQIHPLADDPRDFGFVTHLEPASDNAWVYVASPGRVPDTIRLLDLTTGEDRAIYTLTEDERGVAALDAAPDGSAVLFQDITIGVGAIRFEDLRPYHLLTRDGQKTTLGQDIAPVLAGWSPHGSGLAISGVGPFDAPESIGLYLTTSPTDDGRQVLAAEDFNVMRFAGTTTYSDRLDWGANNTLLLVGHGGSPLIIVKLG